MSPRCYMDRSEAGVPIGTLVQPASARAATWMDLVQRSSVTETPVNELRLSFAENTRQRDLLKNVFDDALIGETVAAAANPSDPYVRPIGLQLRALTF